MCVRKIWQQKASLRIEIIQCLFVSLAKYSDTFHNVLNFFVLFSLSDINFTPSKLEILAIEGFIFSPASLYLRILSKVLTGIFMHSNTAWIAWFSNIICVDYFSVTNARPTLEHKAELNYFQLFRVGFKWNL